LFEHAVNFSLDFEELSVTY